MSSFFPQDTFFGLDLMSTSLQSFSVAENVTSDNISNVNTPGASRQQVVFTEQQPLVGSPFMATHVPGTAGQGVIVTQIQRIHDNAYDSMFRGASSSQNYYQTQQNTLQAVQSQLGDPNSGIAAEYSAFQTAVTQLVNQASSGNATTASQNVLTQAQALTTSLNNAGNTITAQQQSVLQQGGTLVTTVNGILDQIAALNGQIRASTAVGDNPNTFSDQRDYLIDQLSQYLSTQTSIQADGSTLVTVNGQALVNDTVAYHLAAPTIGTASNGASQFQINFATTPPASSTTPGIPLGSGQLAALQDLYNNKLSPYLTQLNQFATALSTEVNRITTAAYNQNGQSGSALFIPIVSSLPISAGNIQCGITDPTQLPIILANTGAGTLVQPLNSANNTVDTTQALTNNASLANPPAAALAGQLDINVDGIQSIFNYNTGAGGNADTINDFINNFNAGQYGVTASFNTTSQSIVFARDPNNESLALRGLQALAGGSAETPDFTLTDSNFNAANPAASLLGVLGANAISGVDQNQTNAYGQGDNSGANALVNLFQANVGIPSLSETSNGVAAVAGVATTVTVPAGTDAQVGQQLTLAAGTATQENVTITSISYNAAGVESVTFTTKNNHAANFTIASTPTQTLQQFYSGFATQVGIDTQTAITGTTTQTNLANTINSQRQSIDGINLDEETQNLIKYQNAYSAAAKTISTLNSLLGTIINGLGVGQ
jgi:flagellar hook-associated protein 1 FlgK